jgi:serine O-acetyltransferase
MQSGRYHASIILIERLCMQLSLPREELKRYINAQLSAFFPDGRAFEGADVDAALAQALDRVEFCFQHIAARGYNDEGGKVTFSHLHSDQYCSFLYMLANSLWHYSQNKALCDKLTVLNRTLHSMFLSYKVELPRIFYFEHAVGSILGHADYSDFLVVLQNVTVNTATPPMHIGKGVFLSAGSTLVGNKPIGDRTSVGANALVFDREIPADSIVFKDETGALQVRRRSKQCKAQELFNVPL